MKKKQKKSKKIKKKTSKIKKIKRLKKPRKKTKKKHLKPSKKKFKKLKFKRINKKKYDQNATNAKKDSLALKLVKLQIALKPEFNFKIKFSLEKYIQGFFDKISETISNYKILKKDEKRRLKLEKIENERNIKLELERKKQEENIWECA